MSVLYGLALLINMFHLFVLANLKGLKGVPYRHVLIHLTLSDIAISGSMVVYYSCVSYFSFINFSGPIGKRLVLNSVISTANYIGFYVFAIGSVEKYKALCRPLTYNTSKFICRIPVAFGAAWALVAAVTTFTAFLKVTGQCPYVNSTWFQVSFLVIFAMTPSLFSVVVLAKVYGELRRMQNRSETANEDRQTKRAAIYFITIFILFMVALLINIIALSVGYSTGNFIYTRVYHILKAAYTVSNTFIYGWSTKSYRRYILNMLRCNRKSSVAVAQ